MKKIASGLAAAFLSFATPVWAQDSPVVVELFTSQGCSSCPPADAMLHELAVRDDVIAIALHVDYWDYIGWKDEFADPAYAKRQRKYARVGGRRSVYTPQMIVNGQTDIVGAKAMKLSAAIAAHAAQPMPVAVSLTRSGDTVQIKADAQSAGSYVVQLLRYQPLRESRITRGENAGQTLKYANVAQDWQELAQWNGQSALTLTAPAPGDAAIVVLVQHDKLGPIVGAARLR
ncbi:MULTISPECIES: DUF1223 domain-containing protein [Ascidiaceihabitans]|uniref:DUF1223 domain-containing protein n=1 Tax=Ascidiaceihabitans donghaensis TaxID=1510460 RepID=A0A2R8BCM5_9RHOB|nr:DUF1223 domain-containing protein [Ascidiaceihabitans donghaensis]SPH20816.1 hypothetical protein ASD8599_01557 [Ascidiaceihabitans donghaensis]